MTKPPSAGGSLPPDIQIAAGRAAPKQERLRTFLHRQTQEGHLKAGDPLPSEQKLAALLEISRSTLRQSLVRLEHEELVYRIHGRGTFVRDGAHKQIPNRIDALGLVVNKSFVEPFPSLFHGLEIAAEEMHNQILMSSSHDDPNRQGNIILQFLEKRVAGLVIVPTLYPGPPQQLRLLQQNNIPVVCCHRRVEGVDAPLVELPTYDVTRMAGRELVKCGHRNIAMIAIAGTSEEMVSLYVEGMRDAVLPTGGTVNVVRYDKRMQESLDYKVREKMVADQLKSLMEQDDRPTALMNWFDEDAELVYMVLSQLGLRIPEDISVISFGGRPRRGSVVSRLTAITIDGMETGRLAGKLLKEMIDGERPINDTEQFKLSLEFHPGETLGPPHCKN